MGSRPLARRGADILPIETFMMDDMPLMTAEERAVAVKHTPTALGVRVEEFARGRRVRIAGEHAAWMLVLPTDGYEFDLMQYQVTAENAARSAVLELKLDGPTYRQAIAPIREGASPADVLAAIRILLGPVMPLMGLLDAEGATGRSEVHELHAC